MEKRLDTKVNFENGLVFTKKEFVKIKSIKKTHKYWEFLNKINYYNKNYISICEVTNSYQSSLFEIYKFPDHYIIDYVNSYSFSLWRYDNIEDLIDFLIKF